MSLPQSNAALTLIAQPGGSEDYDTDASAGPTRWAGTTRAYVLAETERVSSGTDSTVLVTRTLILPATLASVVSQGDILTVVPDIGTPLTVAARQIRVAKIPGVPGTIRIELEDQ